MAKTLAEIRQEINSFTKYSPEESVYHFPRLWQELQDEVSAALLDLVDHIEAGEGAELNFDIGTVISNIDPNFNPNVVKNVNGIRKYAGVWNLIPDSLIQYTATTNAGDYQLTSMQLKQILTSWRTLSSNNLPSGNFPLSGVTTDVTKQDGSPDSINFNIDSAVPIADWANPRVFLADGRASIWISPSPRLKSEAYSGWGSAYDFIKFNGSHRHNLSSGYVKFNNNQEQLDIRQKGYLAFSWVRVS